MEESVLQQKKLWKEVLDTSGILTQLKSLMSTLPVNMARDPVSKTWFGQENQNFYTDNAATSMSETQRVCKSEEKIAMVSQEVKLLKIWVGGMVTKIG